MKKKEFDVKCRKGYLIIWAKNKTSETMAQEVRKIFDKAGFQTDRCWSNKQIKAEKPLGVRIYIGKS